MTRHATAADFTHWEELAEAMTDAQLHYAAADCFATAEAMRGWNPVAEGFYLDQGCTYGDALRRRRASR